MSETEVLESTDEKAPPKDGGVSTSEQETVEKVEAKAEPNGKTDTIASSTEETGKTEVEKPYWPDDWREKAAKHVSAGDEKAYKRELKRLERITDPASIFGMYRELESKFTSGNLIKKPGNDATDEEKAAYYKSLGVPEKPDGYFENMQLPNGLVLGEDDMPAAKDFATLMHTVGSTPEQMKAAFSWYLQTEENKAAEVDEQDDAFRREAEQVLKDELGPAYRRTINNIGTVFQAAPGGADINNEESVYSRLMGGRTADGKIIGNDPDVVRWLSSLAQDINPAAAVVEDGDQSGQSVEQEIAAIESSWKDPKEKRAYFKDEGKQARYRKLLDTREKIRARAR